MFRTCIDQPTRLLEYVPPFEEMDAVVEGDSTSQSCSGTTCKHLRRRTLCRECNGQHICKHQLVRYDCSECRGTVFCRHNRRRRECAQCEGSSMCPHKRKKSECKECNGSGICACGIKKRSCPKHGGSALCLGCKVLHGNSKYDKYCRACFVIKFPNDLRCSSRSSNASDTRICEHNRRRTLCKTCSGQAICRHGLVRYECDECRGTVFCIHNRRRRECVECGGSSMCAHQRKRTECKECSGSGICSCGMNKRSCPKHGGSALCVECRVFHSNSKYDKHCMDCFVNKFPSDPRSSKTRGEKRIETVVREAIDAAFDGFVHDKTMFSNNCDCSHRRRIDHRLHVGDTILAVETDEFAHRSYSQHDEEVRYDDVTMIHTGKWVWIRFNPHSNREASHNKTGLENKLRVLIDCIREQVARIGAYKNTEMCQIIKLFY